jgi:hypothetical protein
MAALTDDEYSAFVRYLRDHPEAVDELRPLFLTREVLEMPAQLARLEADSVRLREEFHAFRLEITAKTEALRQELIESRAETQRLFAQLVRRIDDLEGLASAVGAGELAEEDVDDLSRADFIISGRKPPPSAGELFAIVEISLEIDRADIDRAARRAGILSRAGYDAVAIVGGYELTADANEHARRMGVGIDLRQLVA